VPFFYCLSSIIYRWAIFYCHRLAWLAIKLVNIPYINNKKRSVMKRIFFVGALALAMLSCGNNNSETETTTDSTTMQTTPMTTDTSVGMGGSSTIVPADSTGVGAGTNSGTTDTSRHY
jgi:hypothetical protein